MRGNPANVHCYSLPVDGLTIFKVMWDKGLVRAFHCLLFPDKLIKDVVLYTVCGTKREFLALFLMSVTFMWWYSCVVC